MSRNIEQQINAISDAVNVINNSDRCDVNLVDTRIKLINIRRTLKQVKYAQTVKPAVAVYGASQVGKSYLVDTLLKDKNGELEIVANRDGDKEITYSFLRYLDPMGCGAESTAVISRFTTDDCLGKNPKFPIKTRVMSPCDVILTLCDTYYNDIKDKKSYTNEELVEKIQNWKQKYGKASRVQCYLTEDDIYEIKDYLNSDKNFSIKLREIQDLTTAGYFDELSLIIENVPENEWVDVLAVLWGEVDAISGVFVRLMNAMRKLQYKDEVYIPIESLFREKGTLLSVDRLDEFFNVVTEGDTTNKQNFENDVQVYVSENNIVTLTKGEFCALSIEYVMKISAESAKGKDFMIDSYAGSTSRVGSDVLDFPGARSREVIYLKDLTDSHVNEKGETISPEKNKCTMLKRGKVAYLFNKYTDQYLINSLLACYENKQNEVKILPGLIASWVNKMVGDTSEKRDRIIAKYKLSPLFIVGTKYNLDLAINPINEADGIYKDIDKRWENRFISFLCNGIISTNNVGSWFNDWTTSRRLFNNIYLLRSFKYSNNIFNEQNGELGYREHYKEHLDKLKESFMNFDFVKNYIKEDAEDLWNDSSTPGHDGSERIIKNLTLVTKNSGEVRDDQFSQIVNESFEKIISLIEPLYSSGKEGDLIMDAIRTSGRIKVGLDILFHKDPYLFSNFIKTLHVNESDLHDLILKELNDPNIIDKTGVALLMMIRLNAGINDEDDKDKAVQKMIKAYHFRNEQDVFTFLESKGLSIDDIITYRPSKSFATIIGEMIEKYWFEQVLDPKRFESFNVDRGLINELMSRMKMLYKERLNITKIVIDTITPYVADPAATIDYVDMLADIGSEIINRYVNEMGYPFYEMLVTKDTDRNIWDDLVEANQKYNLNLNLDRKVYEDDEEANSVNNIADAFMIINDPNMLNDSNMGLLPNVKNLIRWERLMEICFVATCSIPTYNIEENERIRQILASLDPDNEKYK